MTTTTTATSTDSGQGWIHSLGSAARIVLVLVVILIVVQSLYVVQARPQDLVTGIHGMADILRRVPKGTTVETLLEAMLKLTMGRPGAVSAAGGD